MDPLMLTVLSAIGLGLACLGIGIFIGRSTIGGGNKKALQSELEETKEAFESYRGEVVQQFAETAGKFRRLNESYADLHQQLATSASVLCADRAEDVLLALPGTQASATEDPDAIEGSSEAVEAEANDAQETAEVEASADASESAPSESADPVAEVDLPEPEVDLSTPEGGASEATAAGPDLHSEVPRQSA